MSIMHAILQLQKSLIVPACGLDISASDSYSYGGLLLAIRGRIGSPAPVVARSQSKRFQTAGLWVPVKDSDREAATGVKIHIGCA